MDSKSNIVSELLNIMNFRDLPRSLYSVFGRQVLSLPPAKDLSMFIELSLSPSGQITATWNCTFKPLRYCSWGNTAGKSLSTMFSTKDSWAPGSWPLAGHFPSEAQAVLQMSCYRKYFFPRMPHNPAMVVSLAAASSSAVFWDWPPGRAEQFALCLHLLIHR